jgi:hypothetical protein
VLGGSEHCLNLEVCSTGLRFNAGKVIPNLVPRIKKTIWFVLDCNSKYNPLSKIFIFLYVLLCPSNNDADTSELSVFIRGTCFKIDTVYFGGIVGQQSGTYEFPKKNVSVRVQVFFARPLPRQDVEKIMISMAHFAEVKESLHCTSVTAKANPPVQGRGAWDEAYFRVSGFKRIRVCPSRTDTFSREEIIYVHRRRGPL